MRLLASDRALGLGLGAAAAVAAAAAAATTVALQLRRLGMKALRVAYSVPRFPCGAQRGGECAKLAQPQSTLVPPRALSSFGD